MLVCPQCNNSQESGKFCGKCGTQLDAPVENINTEEATPNIQDEVTNDEQQGVNNDETKISSPNLVDELPAEVLSQQNVFKEENIEIPKINIEPAATTEEAVQTPQENKKTTDIKQTVSNFGSFFY